MRRNARSGFTLLEMLLSITLLSLIIGSILGGLHLGRRSWESGRLYEGVGEVEDAARAIHDQLARIYPAQVPRADNAATVAFLGRPDDCRIVTLSEGGAQYGGLILTEIGGDGGGVGMWTRVFRTPDWETARRGDMNAVSVLRDAAYFSLSYFGEVERGKPPAWTDSWVERDGLPLLIGVRLGGRVSGKVVDASFVVAVRQSCAAGFYKCPDNVAR